MDDKSIEKTNSTLNGHGIAVDDPTSVCVKFQSDWKSLPKSRGSRLHEILR